MSLISKLFGGGQSQAEADANLARQQGLLSEQAQRRYEAGETEREKYERDMEFAGRVSQSENVGAAWKEGFGEGWDEGKSNIEKFSWGAIGKFLGSIPSLVWVAAFVAIFVYLGGGVWALKKAKKIFA